MGVPNFWTYVKNNYSNNKISINDNLSYLPRETFKKYDFLIIDFHSLIYSTYAKFSQEINYFIRLIILLNNKTISLEQNILDEESPNYSVILNYIINEYEEYFDLFGISNLDNIENIYEKIISKGLKNQDVIIQTLSNLVIKLVKDMADHHIKNQKSYYNTYIYFDGIPSISKIKEQLVRRVFPLISAEVKKDIFASNSENWNEILNSMLPEAPPSISLGSPIIMALRNYFENFSDAKKGKFKVNDVRRYGEAEHQIMKDININEIFHKKKILLASPDGDLILLSIINFAKFINFDIIRVNAEQEDKDSKKYKYIKDKRSGKFVFKSGYKYVYDYIYIENFCKSFELYDKDNNFLFQKAFDFAYLLLLLGDDFIPIIPSMNIKSIETMWETYNTLYETGLKIIEYDDESGINNLNYQNLFFYFNELSKFEETMNEVKMNECRIKNEKRIDNIDKNFKNVAKIYNLDKFKLSGLLSNDDNLNFKKNYYFNEGIVGDDFNTNLLSCSDETLSDSSDDKIISYLKGCKFVFEVYLNNRIENYKWYYKYENAPTLNQISSFLEKNQQNLGSLFNNVDFSMQNYFDLTNYKQYILDNSNSILVEFMKKICVKKNINKLGELDILVKTNFVDVAKFESLKKELLTYNNIISISHCPNKQRYNKCFEPEQLLDTKPYLKRINSAFLGGKYKNKYEKYISKINNL